MRRDAGFVVVAEETVQDGRLVEAGDYEAAEVGEEGDEGSLSLSLLLVRMWRWAGEAVCRS